MSMTRRARGGLVVALGNDESTRGHKKNITGGCQASAEPRHVAYYAIRGSSPADELVAAVIGWAASEHASIVRLDDGRIELPAGGGQRGYARGSAPLPELPNRVRPLKDCVSAARCSQLHETAVQDERVAHLRVRP